MVAILLIAWALSEVRQDQHLSGCHASRLMTIRSPPVYHPCGDSALQTAAVIVIAPRLFRLNSGVTRRVWWDHRRLGVTGDITLSDFWSAASQVIRYPWYTATLLGGAPHALTWLRYTAFYVLYPASVAAIPTLVPKQMTCPTIFSNPVDIQRAGGRGNYIKNLSLTRPFTCLTHPLCAR